MSTEPKDWDCALRAAGFIDRRGGDRVSWSALAQAVGVHTSTLTGMKDGSRETDGETLDLVAEKLRLDPRIVAEWVGRARAERDPYKPPSDADLLTRQEREAVNRLIQLLAEPKKRGQSDGRSLEAQKNPDDDGGAGATVTPIRPDNGALAARKPKLGTPSKHQHDPMAHAGEESQDNGTDDPA